MGSRKTKKDLVAEIGELHRRLVVLSCTPDSMEALTIRFGYIRQVEVEKAMWAGRIVPGEAPAFTGFFSKIPATEAEVDARK